MENEQKNNWENAENQKTTSHQEEVIEKKKVANDPILRFKHYKESLQLGLLVLWRIHQKKYTIGSRIFYEELVGTFDLDQKQYSKTAYKEALAFLEGAGAAVNEVIILEKVPAALLQRYPIENE